MRGEHVGSLAVVVLAAGLDESVCVCVSVSVSVSASTRQTRQTYGVVVGAVYSDRSAVKHLEPRC